MKLCDASELLNVLRKVLRKLRQHISNSSLPLRGVLKPPRQFGGEARTPERRQGANTAPGEDTPNPRGRTPSPSRCPRRSAGLDGASRVVGAQRQPGRCGALGGPSSPSRGRAAPLSLPAGAGGARRPRGRGRGAGRGAERRPGRCGAGGRSAGPGRGALPPPSRGGGCGGAGRRGWGWPPAWARSCCSSSTSRAASTQVGLPRPRRFSAGFPAGPRGGWRHGAGRGAGTAGCPCAAS